MDTPPPGSGRRKAARLVSEARRRVGLSQTELARITAVPLRTLTRIEAGDQVPRADTLERLLLGCGRTLTTEPRSNAPDRKPGGSVASNALRALMFLKGGGVEHVVVGALAARLHGAGVEVRGVDILIPDSEGQRIRLVRAVQRLDRPYSRVAIVPVSVAKERFDRTRRAAELHGPVPSPVACLDDLIELERAETLRCSLAALREELDRG